MKKSFQNDIHEKASTVWHEVYSILIRREDKTQYWITKVSIFCKKKNNNTEVEVENLK